MIASVGGDREAVWRAVQSGTSGVKRLRGVPAVPDGLLLGATVTLPSAANRAIKNIPLCLIAAQEALADADCRPAELDRDRFGCAVSAHMGDTRFVVEQLNRTDLMDPEQPPWWEQWFPNAACAAIARHFGLYGPRICHSTACSSGLIDILCAVRAITDGQCDIALAGSSEAIHPLFAAGFYRMGVLAMHEDPTCAARPFDRNRCGFVMGEGAAMLVLERLGHARARGASIYAEIVAGHILADAFHVTGLDTESEALAELIRITLHRGGIRPGDIGYVNAHGTGTRQNDATETRGIRRAMGPAAETLCASSTKSMLGHLVNASGSVELAITALALRDGFVPPTINLTDPDPACDLDYIPLVGRKVSYEHALKVSLAFGGHLAAVAIRRWDAAASGREPMPVAEPAR